MNRTQIEWALNPDGTPGYTWNPITGCNNQVDGMCGGNFPCYAYRQANTRLKERYLANKNTATKDYDEDSYPFYPRFWKDRLPVPVNYQHPAWSKKPRGIFVCDMSDLFGIGIPEEWIQQQVMMRVIKFNPHHRFYLLTKQPQNLIKFSPFPDNAWVGVSVTGLEKGGFLEPLHQIEATVKYISFEPLLAKVIEHSDWLVRTFEIVGIKWVIIGAQTKPYKPPKIEWVREIVEACDKAGIPVFLKNNLEKMCFNAGYEAIKDMNFWEEIHHTEDLVLSVDFRQEMPSGR